MGAKWLPARRIIRGARCVGVAQRLLEICSEYAQNWDVFGKVISEQQRIQRIIADLATDIQAARLLTHYTACMFDEGKGVRREVSMVKVYTSSLLDRAADQTVLLHGGPGNVKGVTVERLCRNTAAAGYAEEALDLQRAIIAREIMSI